MKPTVLINHPIALANFRVPYKKLPAAKRTLERAGISRTRRSRKFVIVARNHARLKDAYCSHVAAEDLGMFKVFLAHPATWRFVA